MKECEDCINSRLVVSENGYHAICTLPEKDMTDCMYNDKMQFIERPMYCPNCGAEMKGDKNG